MPANLQPTDPAKAIAEANERLSKSLAEHSRAALFHEMAEHRLTQARDAVREAAKNLEQAEVPDGK